MKRTSINPSSWSLDLGFDQGQLIEGHRRQLLCSGQDSVDDGGAPQHPDDLAAQLEMSIDNVARILDEADMTLANIVRITVYALDVAALFSHWNKLTDRVGHPFVTSIVGVSQLPAPQLQVLLEVTAYD